MINPSSGEKYLKGQTAKTVLEVKKADGTGNDQFICLHGSVRARTPTKNTVPLLNTEQLSELVRGIDRLYSVRPMYWVSGGTLVLVILAIATAYTDESGSIQIRYRLIVTLGVIGFIAFVIDYIKSMTLLNKTIDKLVEECPLVLVDNELLRKVMRSLFFGATKFVVLQAATDQLTDSSISFFVEPST
ncbi:MAG: hypothetical protein AAF583_06595 [Pseudomonadota bacterium]